MNQTFDEFSKALAAPLPRREPLGRLGAAFAAAVVTAVLLSVAPGAVQAGTFYSSTSTARVTFAGVRDADGNTLESLPVGLSVSYLSLYLETLETLGTGFGSVTASATLGNGDLVVDQVPYFLGIGESVTEAIATSGGTIAPGDFSLSVGGFFSVLGFANQTDQAYALLFDYQVDYEIASQVDDPATEYAYAAELVLDLSSGVSRLDIFDLVEYTASRAGSESRSFEIALAPQDFGGVFILHASGGDPFTTAVVPEPASALLFAVAGVGLAVRRRRQRCAS